jgi:Bacterial PH domain
MNYGVMLQPGEAITKVIHRSLISLVPTTFTGILLIVISVGFAYFDNINPRRIALERDEVVMISLILLGIALIIVLAGIYIYTYNVLIFTNLHLIEVEQNGIFGRVISQVSFDREQDISGNRTGFFATVFNYGSVTVQSAGENVYFVFRYAPNPEAVANEAIATNEASMGSGEQGLG